MKINSKVQILTENINLRMRYINTEILRKIKNNSILGYKVRKCIITESRKSLKNRNEVEIFQLPRFYYGTY
jgi:hypothetical protein